MALLGANQPFRLQKTFFYLLARLFHSVQEYSVDGTDNQERQQEKKKAYFLGDVYFKVSFPL